MASPETPNAALASPDILSPGAAKALQTEASSRVFNELVSSFNRNVRDGYLQSHPLDHLFLAEGNAVDSLTFSNNYMRAIFGGVDNPALDANQRAYTSSLRDWE